MTDQLLIDLPEIKLPRDLAWRVKFIEAVENHLKLLGVAGRFEVPRFFGYYFCRRNPVVMARQWKVTLEAAPLLSHARNMLERITDRKFSIVTTSHSVAPDYLLVHDRFDGSCWLWGFENGRRFVDTPRPVTGEIPPARDIDGWDGGPKYLGL